MTFRQTTVSGIPAIALRSEEVDVVVVPALGMLLTTLRRLRGREWLWRNEQIPLRLPKSGASYTETADSGGWDECFPTVAESMGLPDHGELWSGDWTSSVYQHAGGTTLAASVTGRARPFEFHRELTLDPVEPVLRVRYRLRHTGNETFPWIWSAHPLFNVQPGSTLILPSVSQVKLDTVHGRSDLARGDTVSWAGAIGGEQTRFVFPQEGGWALKAFADIGPSGRMTLTDPRQGERLELVVRPGDVPQVGLWINCRGWAPPGKTRYYNLGLEPCIGAPDRLEDAIHEWGAAQFLQPGEERSWGLEVWLPPMSS